MGSVLNPHATHLSCWPVDQHSQNLDLPWSCALAPIEQHGILSHDQVQAADLLSIVSLTPILSFQIIAQLVLALLPHLHTFLSEPGIVLDLGEGACQPFAGIVLSFRCTS